MLVTTRHDAHAREVMAALEAGKHSFVEKALALTLDEVDAIESAARSSGKILMVGFNRRFGHLSIKMMSLLAALPGPKSFVATINAGAMPADHWTQVPEIGGGRIVGESCHFIELLRDWAGAPIEEAKILYLGGGEGRTGDTATISLSFADGSIGSIQYLPTGDTSSPKSGSKSSPGAAFSTSTTSKHSAAGVGKVFPSNPAASARTRVMRQG